ncbi:hypothetical protein [Caballeronia sp. RCC_10]|uniref:hypothetical protein n=1 Tax=Caballeronia sp. RCC_10 TaxID=3239227 RepID=UPI0035252CFF
MTIDAFGELPVIVNIDRRTGFGGLIPVEPPPAQDPHFYFPARLFYRRSTGELFETGVYRRLYYPNLSFSVTETAHRGGAVGSDS